MDLRELKKLVSLMNENGLTRLEVEEEGKRYLLEKGAARRLVEAVEGETMPLAAAGVSRGAAPAESGRAAPPREDTITFNSPMIGTFYQASSPDAGAFVRVGDHVEPETVVCLIEAMKVFNEIKAEMSGTIIEILAENQEAVEYNQPLFLIKPD